MSLALGINSMYLCVLLHNNQIMGNHQIGNFLNEFLQTKNEQLMIHNLHFINL